MQNRYLKFTVIILIFCLKVTACGDGGEQWAEQHGYGPVTEPLELGELDEDLAREGKQIFSTYCEACHAMNATISGPALRRIVEQRTPEFVINYTLNPRENRENHPIGRQLSGNFAGGMTNTGINEEQARAVYEYLRYYNERGEINE